MPIDLEASLALLFLTHNPASKTTGYYRYTSWQTPIIVVTAGSIKGKRPVQQLGNLLTSGKLLSLNIFNLAGSYEMMSKMPFWTE
jgi:hypothetical protein